MTLPSSSSSSWISFRGKPSSFRTSGSLNTCVAAYFACVVFNRDDVVLMICCTSDSNENAYMERKDDDSSHNQFVWRGVQRSAGSPGRCLCHRAKAAFSLLSISLDILNGCSFYYPPFDVKSSF